MKHDKPPSHEIWFYEDDYYELSNFSPHQVKIWDILFPTAEHAFQFKKFEISQPEIADSIRTATSPFLAKQISTKHKSIRISNWSEIKTRTMKQILEMKYAQHEDVRERLNSTEDKIIHENSKSDYFWGRGADGTGQSWVGKLWMEIRESHRLTP